MKKDKVVKPDTLSPEKRADVQYKQAVKEQARKIVNLGYSKIRARMVSLLHSLKEKGIGVSVTHWRFVELNDGIQRVLFEYPTFKIRENGWMDKVSPYGGYTSVCLYIKGATVQGKSYCHDGDHFCRLTGLLKAMERAMNKADELGLKV